MTEQSSTATTAANIWPLTCSRREHGHGFFHGPVTSGRGAGDTWTGTKEIRVARLQQVAWLDQLMTIGSGHTRETTPRC